MSGSLSRSLPLACSILLFFNAYKTLTRTLPFFLYCVHITWLIIQRRAHTKNLHGSLFVYIVFSFNRFCWCFFSASFYCISSTSTVYAQNEGILNGSAATMEYKGKIGSLSMKPIQKDQCSHSSNEYLKKRTKTFFICFIQSK